MYALKKATRSNKFKSWFKDFKILKIRTVYLSLFIFPILHASYRMYTK